MPMAVPSFNQPFGIATLTSALSFSSNDKVLFLKHWLFLASSSQHIRNRFYNPIVISILHILYLIAHFLDPFVETNQNVCVPGLGNSPQSEFYHTSWLEHHHPVALAPKLVEKQAFRKTLQHHLQQCRIGLLLGDLTVRFGTNTDILKRLQPVLVDDKIRVFRKPRQKQHDSIFFFLKITTFRQFSEFLYFCTFKSSSNFY